MLLLLYLVNLGLGLDFLGTVSANVIHRKEARDNTATKDRNGVKSTIFKHMETGTQLEYVTNSGICETTPGVQQHSGYISVGQNMNMWFWFFESRNNPENAPLVAWFNGGPGCSSMIGLFQENGPCTFNNGESADKPSLNKHSFNEYANMLYIDQPISVGFSYGDNSVDTTASAAPIVWKLLQAFHAKFPQYQSRDFGIFTESYGGHYGPGFSKYILDQNDAIDKGTVTGQKINLIALGINNGWINPYHNYKGIIDFSVDNEYKKLITKDRATTYYSKLDKTCLPLLQKCWKDNTNSACAKSVMTCSSTIESPITRSANFSAYDVRRGSSGKWPPMTYEKFLQKPGIQKAIGATRKYSECPDSVHMRFTRTGDDSRNYLPILQDIVNRNVTTLIWAGDSDWICNWRANLYSAEGIKYPGQEKFKKAAFKSYTVNGEKKGEYKTVDNLSFLRVHKAGHTVMAYQPDVSLQAFIQTLKRQSLSPT